MLAPRGVCVPDWPPPFPFALSRLPAMARSVEPFVVAGLSDREAWHSLFTDAQRLDWFRAVHGNRKGRRPKPQAPTLFDA